MARRDRRPSGSPPRWPRSEGSAVASAAVLRRGGVIEHAPEGRTEVVSTLRGNSPLAAAAKCLILMIKIGKRTTRYVLGVVPGDARIDLVAVKRLFDGTYVAFADAQRAEELGGSLTGTILPMSFHPGLDLIVDPSLLEQPDLYFNAGRLDRSLALDSGDYVRLVNPRLERIATPA